MDARDVAGQWHEGGVRGGLDWNHLGVLMAWGAVGALIAIRRFRWEPRPE